ncbi:hypothetical protein Tco_0113685, partial [Tanacetum coccineum]
MLQLIAVRQNVNSVRPNVNTGRANVNSVSNSNSFSPVRPHVNKFNQRSTAIKTSAGSSTQEQEGQEGYHASSSLFKQKIDGIFISQDKYVADMLKKFDLTSVKTIITPIETKMALTKDEEADEVDVHLYRSMI